MIAELDVLAALLPPAFVTDANLFALVVCRMVNLSLQHGAAGAAAYAYAFFGMLLGPVFHRYAEGTRFARVALAHRGAARLRGLPSRRSSSRCT